MSLIFSLLGFWGKVLHWFNLFSKDDIDNLIKETFEITAAQYPLTLCVYVQGKNTYAPLELKLW